MTKTVTDMSIGLTARPFIGTLMLGGCVSIHYNTILIGLASMLITILLVATNRAFKEVLISHKVFLSIFTALALSSTIIPYILFSLFPETFNQKTAIGISLTLSVVAGIVIFKFYTKSSLIKLGWEIIEAK